ncbi:phosphopantothenate--cysteine ligase 2 [Gossypium australe]|uniref:Phosphopantothenate--cysteine ligase 2 n=1 Tax=Gossypium australe TaxID=47621 RepID=A0A5B6V803_9ROSI|nr:phosphopantothenate--cysteine ligase 2 [Gossypium australe]
MDSAAFQEEIDSFFESAPPLKDSAKITDKLNQFIQFDSPSGEVKGRRVVCVTSGGTTVPLEQRCVRYIDNFSSGNRGAASTEYFIKAGYKVEHKIQSASGPLDMRLMQVPKMLSVLRTEWTPKAFCISFKLETDSKILLEKATMALKKYKMHAVVANELLTRKEVVTVVTDNGNISVHRDKTWAGSDVEDPLIELLVNRHSTYIKDPST